MITYYNGYSGSRSSSKSTRFLSAYFFKTPFLLVPRCSKADNVLWMDPNISESQDAMAEAVDALRHAEAEALQEDCWIHSKSLREFFARKNGGKRRPIFLFHINV